MPLKVYNFSPIFIYKELRDRLVPTDDVFLVKMIRNLLLNESKDVTIAFPTVEKAIDFIAHNKACDTETNLSDKSIPEIADISCANDETRCVEKTPALNKRKSGIEPKMSEDIQQMNSPEVTTVAKSVMDTFFSKKRARSDSSSSNHSNSSNSLSSDENSTSSQCSSNSSSISDMES